MEWGKCFWEIHAWSMVCKTSYPHPKAGGPYTITIKGHETIVLENIMIGEVWIGSGQSNMEWMPTQNLANADEEIKNAQFHTMHTVPQTGMVVTNDIGDLNDIHPSNKQDVGKRLALWALAKTYGRTDVVCSGPIFESMEIRKKQAIIQFKYAENGLKQKGETLKEFWIAGEDQQFYPGEAYIKVKKVVVFSPKVENPVAVRFAFSNRAEPNLFNKAGLPASAFRTDDWEIKLE